MERVRGNIDNTIAAMKAGDEGKRARVAELTRQVWNLKKTGASWAQIATAMKISQSYVFALFQREMKRLAIKPIEADEYRRLQSSRREARLMDMESLLNRGKSSADKANGLTELSVSERVKVSAHIVQIVAELTRLHGVALQKDGINLQVNVDARQQMQDRALLKEIEKWSVEQCMEVLGRLDMAEKRLPAPVDTIDVTPGTLSPSNGQIEHERARVDEAISGVGGCENDGPAAVARPVCDGTEEVVDGVG